MSVLGDFARLQGMKEENIPQALKNKKKGRKCDSCNEYAAKIVGMQLTRLYEKGRISDQDRIFYLSIMPNIRMNEAAATSGANELIRLLEEKLVNQVNELEIGGASTGASTGTSTTNDPLGIR